MRLVGSTSGVGVGLEFASVLDGGVITFHPTDRWPSCTTPRASGRAPW